VPSFRRKLSVRLVIVGAIVIMVPLSALFLLVTLPILAPAFDLTACISTMDDVVQVAVVSTTLLAMLLLWSDATGRVPTGTLPVVIFVILISVLLIVD
jgi:hypothetical protein